MSVSLCMIVKNEEATLADCLESVRGVVDETIVLDTGSSDRTVAIAQQFDAKVYSYDWCDDFSAARNAALQYVESDWVLVLDADEVLLPEAVPALRAIVKEQNCLVVNLVRQELGMAQVPYSLVSRLFRNHPSITYSRAYHESIDDSVVKLMEQEPHWRVLELAEVAIRHSGYTAGTIASRDKSARARSIMERYLASHPDDAYTCNKLGALYVSLGETAQGQELLHQGLRSPSIEPAVCYELHYHLACAYSQLELEQADKHFQAAIEQPISRYLKLGAYNNWGNLRMMQDNPAAASVLFQKVVEIDPGFAIGFFNLGTALKALGNLEGAIGCYQKAIELEPSYAEAHQGLGVAWLKGGRVLESLESFRRAIALYREQGSPEADRLQHVLTDMNLLK